ncbi:MAG TPA: hypothetical protein VEL31_16215 [Ktedonobacteraceae bacterium]|nr:hypothetical protein [Ktedonobacteraceae bacterium]
MVTEGELKSLLQANGWYLSWIKKFNKRFAYAKKRSEDKVSTRYLKAESKLDELTEAEVLKRIQS